MHFEYFGAPPMRDLLLRIWRYLNYPADTHSKVEEIWQRTRKFSATESDLRYLKAQVIAVQRQLNSIQDHLRSSQPWLPSQQSLLKSPECLLLAHLAGFLKELLLVAAGPHEEVELEILLNAGFQLYLLEPSPPAAARLRERLGEDSRLRVAEMGVEALSTLAQAGKIPVDYGLLRLGASSFDPVVIRHFGEPKIVVIAQTAKKESSVGERSGNLVSAEGKLMQGMRACGYRWSLLLFKVKGEQAVRFVANPPTSPEIESGSLFFFREYQLFDEAYRWTQTVLPRFQHRAPIERQDQN
jgi:hypothetical protein